MQDINCIYKNRKIFQKYSIYSDIIYTYICKKKFSRYSRFSRSLKDLLKISLVE